MAACTIITNPADIAPSGTRISILLPDDFHHHFRDGHKTAHVVAHAVERFGRAIAMPNLQPPVVNTEMALTYRDHILHSHPASSGSISSSVRMLEPLMTLYLTDHTTPEEISKAQATGFIVAAKYYPAGATTNSAFGVTDPKKCYAAIGRMAEVGMMLCIHSEVTQDTVTGGEVDIFDREKMFIDQVMRPLVHDFPDLKIVMEHISTKNAVDYVLEENNNVRATITPHHLLYNRNALLVGGIRPHLYCLPILKRETHRLALLRAATSGDDRFFAGTDSAPHTTRSKESACGCAGVYTAHAAVELYAEAFDQAGRLDRLENFTSVFGARHYGLAAPKRTLTLEKTPWTVPRHYDFGATPGNGETLTPLRADEEVQWRIVQDGD